MVVECADCGSTENVKTFVFFDGRDDRRLCWDCRSPHIQDRVHPGETDDGDGQDGDPQASIDQFP